MPRLKNLLRQRPEEDGAILVLSAMALVLMMAMAAFAVDYGWLAYNQLEVRKAAESAALAGVVHMPLPGSTTWGAGADAYDTAVDVAGRNGYVGGVSGVTVSPTQTTSPYQVRVTITDEINTFFLKMFIGDTVTVSGEATAEQLPPLRIGSDEPYLGEDPTVSGRNRNFFVAISGEDRSKNQGDAVAAANRQSGGSNPEYDVPSYYYAFEIPVGSPLIGSPVYAQVYDPQTHDAGGRGPGGPNGDTNDWVYEDDSSTNTDGWNSKTRFRVLAPDETPNQWKDNSVLAAAGCDDTYRGQSDFYGEQHAAYDPALDDTWVNLCSFTPSGSGIYVIEVSSDYGASDGTNMINGFSIRGSTNGGSGSSGAVASTSDLQVYGLGSMSLWQFNTGSNPVFKVARLDEIYAGTSLVISLWDVSDIGSSATVEFVGTTSVSGSEIDCEMRVLSDNVDVLGNNIPTGISWGSDSGGATCQLSFTSGQYNNDWMQFKFTIPPDYTCAPGTGSSVASPGCWIFASYSVSGSITDRTVWAASINGQPIHLLP